MTCFPTADLKDAFGSYTNVIYFLNYTCYWMLGKRIASPPNWVFRLFNSILAFTLSTSIHSQRLQSKMSPDVANCPLEGKLPWIEMFDMKIPNEYIQHFLNYFAYLFISGLSLVAPGGAALPCDAWAPDWWRLSLQTVGRKACSLQRVAHSRSSCGPSA